MPYCQKLFGYMAVTGSGRVHIFYYIIHIKIKLCVRLHLQRKICIISLPTVHLSNDPLPSTLHKREQFSHILLFGKHQKKVLCYLIAQRMIQMFSYVSKIAILVCVFKNISCRGEWRTYLKCRGQWYYCRESWKGLTA